MPFHLCQSMKTCNSELGIYGQDSPKALIQYMAESAKQREPNLNAIIVNGDFLAHSLTDNKTVDKSLETIVDIMTQDM